MEKGDDGHSPQKKNKNKTGIVIVIDGTEQHRQQDAQEQIPVLGGPDGKVFSLYTPHFMPIGVYVTPERGPC